MENDNHSVEELQQQVDSAREQKRSLEARFEKKSRDYKDKMSQLASARDAHDKAMEGLLAETDLGKLKEEIKKLFEKCKQQDVNIKKLEFDLEMEKGHVKILRNDNQELKKSAVDMTAIAEQEEEHISNKLLKRISGLQKEKGELLAQVEQEEEYMTNMLQKKLNRLQKEKIDMENALEQEQEYIVNRLQKQLDSLRAQPLSTASSPRIFMQDHGRSPHVRPVSPAPGLSPALSAKKWSSGEVSSAPVEALLAEISSLKNTTREMEEEFLQKSKQCNMYKSELIQLRKQNNMPVDDIPSDEGIPAVFRSVPPSPGRQVRTRSTSTSFNSLNSIPPLQLDNASANSAVSPQTIPGADDKRSRSESTGSLGRASGSSFALNSPPPQHPPHP